MARKVHGYQLNMCDQCNVTLKHFVVHRLAFDHLLNLPFHSPVTQAGLPGSTFMSHWYPEKHPFVLFAHIVNTMFDPLSNNKPN